MKTLKHLWIAIVVLVALSFGVHAQEDTTEAPLEIQTTIAEVTANSAEYYGDVVTIEGNVRELVNVRSFVLAEDALLDSDAVLVVNNSGQTFPRWLTADERVLVTGYIREFTRFPEEGALGDELVEEAEAMTEEAVVTEGETDEIAADTEEVTTEDALDAAATALPESEAPVPDEEAAAQQDMSEANAPVPGEFNLLEKPFDEYTEYTVLEVTNIENVVLAATLNDLVGNPERYLDGRKYAIEGYVESFVDNVSFVMTEDALVAEADILVINSSGEAQTLTTGERVRIYGTVTLQTLTEIEEAFFLDLDNELYVDFEEYTTVIADTFVPLPE